LRSSPQEQGKGFGDAGRDFADARGEAGIWGGFGSGLDEAGWDYLGNREINFLGFGAY
jgi:hypothetical protein